MINNITSTDTTPSRFVEILRITQEVSYPGYEFWVCAGLGEDEYTVYATYDEPDTVTGKSEEQTTREWLIPADFDKSQIVQTLFKCLMTSLEHRGREWFLYRGKSVFGPHYDVDQLWNLCDARQQDAWKDGK